MRRLLLLFVLILSFVIAIFPQQETFVIKPKPDQETVLALTGFQMGDGNQDSMIDVYLETLNGVLKSDLENSGFFRLLSPSFFPQKGIKVPQQLDFTEWRDLNLKIDYIIFGNSKIINNNLIVECWVFDIKTGDKVLGKRYKTMPRYVRKVAHRISDAIVSILTANQSFGVASTQIVFERKSEVGKELYVMDYDGENVHKLTSNSNINLTPEWSPDNSEICFTSYIDKFPGIFFLNVLDGTIDKLNVMGDFLTTPTFSPDGKRIAFSGRLKGSDNPDIYICDLDGKNLVNITQNSGIDISPTFSPSGNQICFVSDRGGSPSLFITDIYGAAPEKIIDEGGYMSSPDWSPDGRFIAFSWRPRGENHFDIYIVEVATKRVFQLTKGQGDNENPSWSPDGRLIVFESNRDGSFDIFRMFADGTNVVKLTSFGGCHNPSWSNYNK